MSLSVDDTYTVYRSISSTNAIILLLRHITFYTNEYQTFTRVHTMKLTKTVKLSALHHVISLDITQNLKTLDQIFLSHH